MNDNDNEDNLPASTPSLGNVLPGDMELHPDFGDVESMWNMRHWLQAALEAKGAKQLGAGMGMGEADIDILLDDHKFNIRIKPL